MTRPLYPVYRVGRTDSPNGVGGLWYDRDGNATGEIHQIDGLANQHLPMPYDPDVAAEHWISAVAYLVDLRWWFPPRDVELLAEHGRCLWSLFVTEYRQADGHILFRERDVVEAHPIGIDLYRAVLHVPA